MDRILINDLLKIPDCDIGKTRLKLNVFNGNTDPLEEYKRDPDKINIEWFLWHNQRRYFHTGQIAICLLYLYDDKWLLTTIKRITKEIDVVDDVGFEAEEIEEYRKYYGRLVLKYHNTKRGMGRTYESMMEELNAMGIRCKHLGKPCKTGVVGKKKRKKPLLQRWTNYIENGHGGNVELKHIVDTKGFDYIKSNFQYSVLENYNARMDDNYILSREKWWKDTLCTKQFGYNKN